MIKELVWTGPGYYVGLNLTTVQRWVQVCSNKGANAGPDWSWFFSEQSAKIWLGLAERPQVPSRKESIY